MLYFNTETRTRVLARFHAGLNAEGILFLGRAEAVMTHLKTFVPIDIKRRISTKQPRDASVGVEDAMETPTRR